MRWIALVALALSACSEPAKTKEGCTIYYTDVMRPRTEACNAAYYAEKARQEGRAVTECYNTGSGVTCVEG